ncbi:MAG: ABC transporter [Candidatus Levybacteria bacterium RIFCSPHIGHO2_02_FULL_40_18]|nr:MAG: ABC transporter [Candidatus Levybacteria bacterium RIFCSPHIGHO2_01_FULL_40_58]OGH26781.1 MAG: ABC transporter [Candidatus Levybacteria bacterium RIFCSPHIGHO2_02_FULL_40_18]OGH31716.1 MAG: ABC transporter [Candidatus Levybacteria bacterium RIFCSPHIGHO2_12_FULL_40_31]OGH40616.1 MAG: ABC transporter [Candidatus Levybacteria bacterium RIFCSPLOWO2_01_FULL_40_64]OGH53335.1 MAG: ABC transporter [Candidatus Levybacteria bacterium RIFCSPLOWO2_12_FULL_40_10]
MDSIEVKGLKKYYKVQKKEAGLAASILSFVNRKYEEVKAVDGISFKIDEGELVGFIGPNGAGKTTTLKCLSGLLYPTAGEIKVLGYTPFSRKTNFLKQIALVMGQRNQLWWDLPPIETFILNKEIYEIPDDKFKKTLDALVSLLDVTDILKTPVKKLSLGQRMKCEFIASVLHSPRVLFLDEPTLGLDVVMQKTLREFIKEYNKQYKATILLTSHYMRDVEALCRRVIIINHGKLLFDGKLSDLVKRHAPYRIVKLTLQKNIDESLMRGLGEIKSFTYPQVVISVPYRRISDVSAKILKDLAVQDLIIEEPEIEDIIREIFEKGKS